MADTSSVETPNETPNQRQARLRREKRAKKMADEGDDRLARIKALNGGVAPPEEVLGGPTSVADDPDEVDISSQNLDARNKANAKDDPIAAAMLQMQTQQAQNQTQRNAEGSTEDDPMVRMMEQMMGLMGGQAGPNADPNAKPPDVPPWMKALLAGGAGKSEQEEKDAAPPATGSAYAWRIVHVVFASVLAAYIALTSTFNGTKLSRNTSVYTQDDSTSFGYGYGLGPRLFLIFCTAQLLLQSSRYFLERGQLQGSGILARVANSGVVPEPWAGYVRVLGRYVGIVQTIFQDAMVVVFVFGCLAWWQGMPVA